jgi:hypothetical protein
MIGIVGIRGAVTHAADVRISALLAAGDGRLVVGFLVRLTGEGNRRIVFVLRDCRYIVPRLLIVVCNSIFAPTCAAAADTMAQCCLTHNSLRHGTFVRT